MLDLQLQTKKKKHLKMHVYIHIYECVHVFEYKNNKNISGQRMGLFIVDHFANVKLFFLNNKPLSE